MYEQLRLALCLLTLAAVPNARLLAASSEPWIDEQTRATVSQPLGAAPAHVLLTDMSCTLSEDGSIMETTRQVVRLLTNKGKKEATYILNYNAKSDSIKTLKSWLIRPGGKTVTRNGGEWLDLSNAASTTLASDLRYRFVSFEDIAVAGDIFAVEVRVQRPLLESVCHASFGQRMPALTERFSLVLPPGFEAQPKLWGAELPQMTKGPDNRLTWTRTATPFRPDEPLSTWESQRDASLAVRIEPPASAVRYTPKRFATWQELADWLEQLNKGRCDTSPALAAKARELAAGCADMNQKIRALASYVQKTRYIASSVDLHKGMGLVANKASIVLERGYGDCKDKANLLRALLREVGIQCHPVAAVINGRGQVHEELPSELYFNHAICAIEVDDSVQSPAVIKDPKARRLLIFDPTDPYTLVGDLPASLQGTVIHVERPADSFVATLPDIDAETGWAMRRKGKMTLEEGGALQLDCELEFNGQLASKVRARLARSSGDKDLDAYAGDFLNDRLHIAKFSERKFEDDERANLVNLRLHAESKDALQHAPGGLVIMRMDVFGRSFIPVFSEKDRQQDIQLHPLRCEDELVLNLPDQLEVNELPRASKVQHEYGSYVQEVRQEGDKVIIRRTLSYALQQIPAADYQKLKAFLGSLARADRGALLLKYKKPATPPAAPSPAS